MNRRLVSHLRSFASGMLLAGLPVAAFMAVDAMVAPPSDGRDAVRAERGGEATQVGRFSARTMTDKSIVAQAPTPMRAADVPSTALSVAQPQAASPAVTPVSTTVTGSLAANGTPLARSIQRELHRVGCLASDANGVWNDETRTAMRAFNTSVRVNLPVERPDYILLTLLQGHSSKACSRTCEGGSSNSCVDKSIEARAIPPAAPVLASRKPRAVAHVQAQPVNRGSWTTTTVAENRPVRSSTPTHTAAAGHHRASAKEMAANQSRRVRMIETAPSVTVALSTNTAPAPIARPAEVRREPLLGRMAVGIGAPPAPVKPAVEQPVHPAVVVPPSPEVRRHVRPRHTASSERHMRREGKTVSKKTRLRRVFSDLSTSSP
ncbi:MAG: hypothetical protein ACK5JT_13800 [Hyphomicrobiaceae bacterium]